MTMTRYTHYAEDLGLPMPMGELCLWIGKRIHVRRKFIGYSQSKVAEKIGVTFQQIQKYEAGASRVPFTRMIQLATALEVDISYFVPTPEQVDRWLTRHEQSIRQLQVQGRTGQWEQHLQLR